MIGRHALRLLISTLVMIALVMPAMSLSRPAAAQESLSSAVESGINVYFYRDNLVGAAHRGVD